MSSMMDLGAALGAQGGDQSAPPDDTSGGGEQFQSSLDALDAAEEALHAFIRLDPDESDRAIASQCLQNVIKLKASNQQDQQQGGMKSFQRALLSGGSGGSPVG